MHQAMHADPVTDLGNLQYYPTPPALAKRMWGKFKDKNFVRVLEPSAGDGHLALAGEDPPDRFYGGRRIKVDVCEIDITHHPMLKSKGLDVVGLDFMTFQSAAHYSHIILNPPFNQGAQHVLKAYDALYDGEIVAIINAASLQNPHTVDRQRLAKLVAEHGEVEYIADAFNGADAEVKADVEIALIWLRKEADATLIIGDAFSELAKDEETGAGLMGDYRQEQAVMLPSTSIENAVRTFNAAVKTMRESVVAGARASYYAGLLGDTMSVRSNGGHDKPIPKNSVYNVRNSLAANYDQLKDRAWSNILRSTDVLSRLSSKAQKSVEAEFATIKKLQFDVPTIYGFLQGLIDSQGEIQAEMLLSCFDEICRYHNDNAQFYKGWKSNDKHLTQARRIKKTRFILPRNTKSYLGLDWDAMQRLADFDKTFAMLDMKQAPDFGLVDLFTNHSNELARGKRMKSDYFECRWYPGATTVHFFPRRPDLIERLNRFVGVHRRWLPPEGAKVSKDFWLQYESEKFDTEIRTEVAKNYRHGYGDPFWAIDNRDPEDSNFARQVVNKAIDTVLERHGINVNFQLENSNEQGQLLLEAA